MTGQKGDPITDRKVWPRRNGTRFLLWPTSSIGALASVSNPPPDGLFDRKAWPKTPLSTLTPHSLTEDTPSPCSLLLSNWRDQSRLGSIDRGRPFVRDQETGREKQGEVHNSNHGTRDHTLHGTIFYNRPDINSVVGAYISPTVLWASLNSHTVRLPRTPLGINSVVGAGIYHTERTW